MEDYIENRIIAEMVEQDLYQERLDECWKRGVHYDKYGREYKLEEMKSGHIINLLNCFYHDYNVNINPLINELKRRNIPWKRAK